MTGGFQVGDIVYSPYSPAQCGVIVEVQQGATVHMKCGAQKPAHPSGVTCCLLSGHTGGSHQSNSGETWPMCRHIGERGYECLYPQACSREHTTAAAKPRFYTPMPKYVVKRPDGSTFKSNSVKLYVQLVEEHERKFETHRAALAALVLVKAKLEATGEIPA